MSQSPLTVQVRTTALAMLEVTCVAPVRPVPLSLISPAECSFGLSNDVSADFANLDPYHGIPRPTVDHFKAVKPFSLDSPVSSYPKKTKNPSFPYGRLTLSQRAKM